MTRIEIVAALLGPDRLCFYLGGDWKTEKKILGINDESMGYFDTNYEKIMAARAISVATALCKAIDEAEKGSDK